MSQHDPPFLSGDTTSMITFDQGGIWSRINPPELDNEGHAFGCNPKRPDCNLHLTQTLSRKYPSTRSPTIKSSKSAIGIVLGTGNVGTTLRDKSDVFLSADAGLSWHQVLKGSWYFNVGDHGGIIVAVKYFKTQGKTNELFYSTNEGIDWKSLVFYHEPVTIFGLITEPGENTTTFTMFGTKDAGIDWIIFTVDLATVFDHVCTADDYKRWSPSDNTQGKHRNCLLGRKDVYERRMVGSNCYNGRDYERLITVENCACDASDYICDFGFKRDKMSSSCVRDPKFESLDPYVAPANCPPHTFYDQTRGYVRIRGDTCQDGDASRYEPQVVGCPLAEQKDFLLIAQRSRIVRLNLRDNQNVETLPVPKEYIVNAITLEYDMEYDCLFFGDISKDKIFMYFNQNGTVFTIVDDTSSVEGMSYDWTTKSLYFVNGGTPSIEMVQIGHPGLNGEIGHRWRRTVLDHNVLSKPRGIAVHPVHGYLYYSDWDDEMPVIGRSHMDGTNHEVLFRKPLVIWPNGLSIDHTANRLYWVDAQKKSISSCDLDGKNFKSILRAMPVIKHPFSVAVHKSLIYWDDWRTKTVSSADKDTGAGLRAVLTNMPGAMDIKSFTHLHQSIVDNPCKGKCSHLCSPVPDGHRCLCPDGMKLDEKLRCVCPDGAMPEKGRCPQVNGQCRDSEFKCSDGYCIPKRWKCDGADDCHDGSDEEGCVEKEHGGDGTQECRAGQFRCDIYDGTAKCIPDTWRCDSDVDCVDGSDEKDCATSTCNTMESANAQFRCDNGQCISAKWRCDLENDCQDGSDEANCTQVKHTCKRSEFQCVQTGQCIPDSWVCDGER